jgi:hypothetical protein
LSVLHVARVSPECSLCGAALLRLRYLFVFVELAQKRMRYAFNQSDVLIALLNLWVAAAPGHNKAGHGIGSY